MMTQKTDDEILVIDTSATAVTRNVNNDTCTAKLSCIYTNAADDVNEQIRT